MCWVIKAYTFDEDEIVHKVYGDKKELFKQMARIRWQYDMLIGLVGTMTNDVMNVEYSYRPKYFNWQKGVRL